MSKFKTGDIVRIVNDTMGYSENFTGQESEVVVENGVCSLLVTYKNGYNTNILSFNDSNLELVKTGDNSVVQQSVDEPVSKFKQGDEVVDILTGDVGVVVGKVIGHEDSRAWDVKWKSGKITGSTCRQWEDRLELVGKYGYTPLQQVMEGCNVATSESVTEYTAADMLQEAKDCLVSRGVERDKPNGERSMKSAVEAFNALTGYELTEEHGWIFMVALKMARSQGGCYKADDYIDMAAYAALAGEARAKEKSMQIKIEDADGDNLTVGHWYKVCYLQDDILYVENDYGEITAVYDYQIAETE